MYSEFLGSRKTRLFPLQNRLCDAEKIIITKLICFIGHWLSLKSAKADWGFGSLIWINSQVTFLLNFKCLDPQFEFSMNVLHAFFYFLLNISPHKCYLKTFGLKKGNQIWLAYMIDLFLGIFFYQMVLQTFSSLCRIQKLTCFYIGSLLYSWFCIVYINQYKTDSWGAFRLKET